MLILRKEQFEKKMLRSRQRANFELLQERCCICLSYIVGYYGNCSCAVYVDASRLLVGVVMIQIIRSHHHDYQKIK